MSIPDGCDKLSGSWAGTNRLWLAPGEPVRVSNVTARVSTAARGRFLTIAYTWEEDGPQEGMILLGWQETNGTLQAAWVDSWHNGDSLMQCQGKLGDDDGIAVRGSYPAPSGPDWGWQITIETGHEHAFRILMDNITPDGEHMLAVEMDLKREGEA